MTAAQTGVRTFFGRDGAAIAFDDQGSGPPILALHGAYSTHHEIRSVLEPVVGQSHRCLYPDLPAMGGSPAHPSISTSAAVVALLDELVDAEIGDAPFLLVGHSYGGHLARGLAARRAGQVAGLALICPLLPGTEGSEPHRVVPADADPETLVSRELVDEFIGYFVLQTPETAARFRDAVVPALGRFDAAAVASMMAAWQLDPDPDETEHAAPTLIVAGRHDAFVGHRRQFSLLDSYPAASYVVVGDAGHAVAHEHPDLIGRLLSDWLRRCSA